MKSDIAIRNDSDLPLSQPLRALLEGSALAALECTGIAIPCEISILLTTDEQIHRLNLEYRGKDRPTDVLSFQLYDSREELIAEAKVNSLADFFPLGDVVIAPRVVRAAAEEIAEPFEKHLCRMCIHSVLHLVGYDHERGKEDELEMIGLQEEILETFWRGKDEICQK